MAFPKQTAELKLSGTYREDRHGRRSKTPRPDGTPRKPRWLNGEAGRYWARVVPKLVEMGVVGAVDADTLGAMCRWWQIWRQCDVNITEGGADSYKWTIQATAAFKQYSSLAARFGLTAVDRCKLTKPDEPVGGGLAIRQRG